LHPFRWRKYSDLNQLEDHQGLTYITDIGWFWLPGGTAMSLVTQGGTDAFIEVNGPPLHADSQFRFDTTHVFFSVMKKVKNADPVTRQARIPLQEVTSVAYWGITSRGDQRRFTFFVASDSARITMTWNSYALFLTRNQAQKDGAQLWSSVASFATQLIHPVIANKLWIRLKAGQQVTIADLSLDLSGITGKQGRKTGLTPWTDVTRTEVTGNEVLVQAGKKVAYRVDRSRPNSLILLVIVAAIAKTGQA
jgi:hypothetical protein